MIWCADKMARRFGRVTMTKGKPKKSVITKFLVGDKVRVKHGTTDMECPDMPMGGSAEREILVSTVLGFFPEGALLCRKKFVSGW